MARVPPAEQWCVCAPVWQPHRRCQDRETLAAAVYMRKFGCVCRLGYLEKRRARYAKQIEEQEQQAAAPLTRAQYTSISGIFGAHWSPSPPIDPDPDPDPDPDVPQAQFVILILALVLALAAAPALILILSLILILAVALASALALIQLQLQLQFCLWLLLQLQLLALYQD